MSHKMYRICLLMVAVAATAGGILYYCTCEKDVETSKKGTLVDQMENTGSKIKRVGKHVVEEVASAMEQTGEEVKTAARNSGREMKRAAVATGYEWKQTAKAVGREIKNEFSGDSEKEEQDYSEEYNA